MYRYRLNKVTEDSYSFAVFDFEWNLITVNIGKENSVRRIAKDMGFDIKEELKQWRLKNTSQKC
tara:strand:- start:470 stop:661 length:192 start_codon:yes stop_codon:yes gene_type:complete